MKKSKLTESQIIKALMEYEGGRSVEDICRELGVKPSTFYVWKRKYLGMDSVKLLCLKELERNNTQLKSMYSDLNNNYLNLNDVVEKSVKPLLEIVF